MKHRRNQIAGLALLCSAALSIAACASNGSAGTDGSSGSGAAPGATLSVANFDPFSGPNAGEGTTAEAGCITAVRVVNQAGGVLGHHLHCVVVDNRGDPADAVPAAQQMLSTTPNLVGIIDEDSSLLGATVPLFNQAHIPDLSLGGDVAFDHNHLPYFWRTIPGDDVFGDALGAYVRFATPYRRIAAVFVNDVSAQGNVPGLKNSVKHLGLNLVDNLVLAQNQTSYQTEIARLKADHVQAIVTETDPQSGGVLLSQMKQAGLLLPMICTGVCLDPNWLKAAKADLGAATLQHLTTVVQQWAPSSGPAWAQYKSALLASAAQIPNVNSYVNDIYPEDNYDGVIMMALAMIAAHSTDPAKFNPYIQKITTGSTVVHTYAQARAALEAGKTIDYQGVEGQIHFDKYHNSAGIWAGINPLTSATLHVMPSIDVTKALGH
ncbi:MAG: ABC transporter substrate-binding protein [Mycobacterium sp.]|nr:ABC transporter substrate-binding protein [Mycobacterium sp.]